MLIISPSPSTKPLINIPDDPRIGFWVVAGLIVALGLLVLNVRRRMRRGDFD